MFFTVILCSHDAMFLAIANEHLKSIHRTMNTYLKSIRHCLWQPSKPLTIVIGNESCDLDSAACAIALAYFYESTANISQFMAERRALIPVLNITRKNLQLKTEVIFFVQKLGINIDDLICRNEVPQKVYDEAKFILVDHHVAKAPVQLANVIEVIDHRPLDGYANFPLACKVTMNEVGSCATLIADVVRTSATSVPLSEYVDVLQLLHSAIILDTLNFSTLADKARPLDLEMVTEIEQVISFDRSQRENLFTELVKARSNVDALTVYQLLWKDLKVLGNTKNLLVVTIPGFPILVQDYVQKPDAWDAVKTFANIHKCNVVVLMGMKQLENGCLRKDLAVVPLDNAAVGQMILQKLFNSKNPDLGLQAIHVVTKGFDKMNLFEQLNVTASRKQILPLVKQILDENDNT